MGSYNSNLIWLLLNFNENIRNKLKIAEKQGVIHKKYSYITWKLP